MGIPLQLYTENGDLFDVESDSRVKIVDDSTRQNLNSWFSLSASKLRPFSTTTNSNYTNNCKLELLNSNSIQKLDLSTTIFKNCNDNHSTLIYDTNWLSPLFYINNENNTFNEIDLINDIKSIFQSIARVIDIDGIISNDNELTLLITLSNNSIILITYDLITFNPILNLSQLIILPKKEKKIVGNKIIKILKNFAPNFLLIITNENLLCFNTISNCFYKLNLTKNLLNENYQYSINFPNLFISNNIDTIYKIDNFLDKFLEIIKFDLTSILKDHEFLQRLIPNLNVTNSQFILVETNQRILSINSLISQYIDFKNILNKNSKFTLILHSNDMNKLILIEKNLYSLSLSLLNWLQQTDQYVLSSYNDLQNGLLNLSNGNKIIHNAQYDEKNNTITIYHSNPIKFETFSITGNNYNEITH